MAVFVQISPFFYFEDFSWFCCMILRIIFLSSKIIQLEDLFASHKIID